MAVRSIILLAALAIFAASRSWHYLRLALLLNGLVQAGDVVVGFIQHDLLKTLGPVFLALLLLLAAKLLQEDKPKPTIIV
ncbi:MAG: hypothetical protein DLM50_02660 [Candidatus Meridianibacter frigidus]|nr:MAG: hypothetical protein DLM50_02660 [Candidatus Eremiobacteraeota bacterium]